MSIKEKVVKYIYLEFIVLHFVLMQNSFLFRFSLCKNQLGMEKTVSDVKIQPMLLHALNSIRNCLLKTVWIKPWPIPLQNGSFSLHCLFDRPECLHPIGLQLVLSEVVCQAFSKCVHTGCSGISQYFQLLYNIYLTFST